MHADLAKSVQIFLNARRFSSIRADFAEFA